MYQFVCMYGYWNDGCKNCESWYMYVEVYKIVSACWFFVIVYKAYLLFFIRY